MKQSVLVSWSRSSIAEPRQLVIELSVIDLSTILLAPAAALTAAWWAQLLGLPSAWLRVRRTQVWRTRPRSVGRIALLKDFIGLYVFSAAVFGALVGTATWIGTFFRG